jgi:hypothetical protein
MMGKRPAGQEVLFYGFSLERHVPPDHLLRWIDRFVDLAAIREALRPFYSEVGRPSTNPELMIRTTPPSPRAATGGSVTATCFVSSSRPGPPLHGRGAGGR